MSYTNDFKNQGALGASFSFDNVSRETIEKLKIYEALLTKWQNSINLVSQITLTDTWHRHFLDSAQLFSYVRFNEKIICLGSGAGFPGAVLAILGCKNVTLVERDRRKCSFLRAVSRETKTPFSVFEGDVLNFEGTASVVVSRAMASIHDLLTLSKRFVNPETRFLFLKGERVDLELEAASKNWEMTTVQYQSITDVRGCILDLTDVASKNETSL